MGNRRTPFAVPKISRWAGVALLVLLHSSAAGQNIYKCVDPTGHITYSDEPCSTAKPGKRAPLPAVVKRTKVPSAYDVQVAEFERQYPPLNVDSPNFDRALTERVLKRKDFYESQAYRSDYALRLAVADVMTPRHPELERTSETTAIGAAVSPRTQPKLISEAAIEGGFRGAFLAVLGLVATFLWWLLGRTRDVVVGVAQTIGATSATDVARRAGATFAGVERGSSGIASAFRDGRRSAQERGTPV